MISSDDPIELFAQRMDKRARTLVRKVDSMAVEAFLSIADIIYIHSPVWSSQSVVNWTASIGPRPKRRLVNVDRSNATIKKGKFSGNKEGDKSNITPHGQIAEMARFQAAAATRSVVESYPKTSIDQKSRPPTLWLSNQISYTGKLWTGRWPGNSKSLKMAVQAGQTVIDRSKVWRF